MRFFKKLKPLITVLFPLLLIIGILMILLEWHWSFPFSIVLPILVAANIIQLFFFLFKRKKYLFLNLISLLLFFFFFDSFYQFNCNTEVKQDEGSLTLLSFNAHWTPGFRGIDYRDKKIVDFVKQNNADVVCFQEFSAIKYHLFKKDYPHWVKTNLMTRKQKSVLAVFSKYPIVNKGYIDFLNSRNNTMYVDIDFKGKTMRVYNVHLESNRSPTMYSSHEKKHYSSLVAEVFEAEKKRTEQARLVKQHMEGFEGNTIVAGDFNCTQYAPAYLILKDSKKDTHIEAGKGFGCTYELFHYPFKIDHILVDEAFQVINHKNFDIDLSDHEPIMAEIKL